MRRWLVFYDLQAPIPLQPTHISEQVVTALRSLLLPKTTSTSTLSDPLPSHGSDAQSLPNQLNRVMACIRSQACKVLARSLTDVAFTSVFMQHCSGSIERLKSLAKECSAGERLDETQALCHRLRLLYRDCAKPPPLPAKLSSFKVNQCKPTSRKLS